MDRKITVKDAQPAAIHLKDYKAPDFSITRTRLEFELFETYADVRATLTIQRQTSDKEAALVLDGQELELLFVSVDDAEIQATNYQLTDDTLAISNVPDRFELVCVTRIKPQENTSLEGLYKSHKMFCTQCEAEGFRKITYYLDRPDVLSEFTTRITADKSKYPYYCLMAIKLLRVTRKKAGIGLSGKTRLKNQATFLP